MDSDVPSSFRDPSGFLFIRDGVLYRQINSIYKDDYEYLMSSYLYQHLVESQLLIPHTEVSTESAHGRAYKVIKPEPIAFISYPYEWCFSQLQDAASTTLRVQKMALDHGMVLKDCSAYNIQFHKGKPIFIDTLSFEKYKPGQPWVAYRQFCQHFLAPLVLAARKDIRLLQLLRTYIDGIPLDLASSLLALRTWGSFPLLVHIHLHARSQKHYEGKVIDTSRYKVSRLSLLGLVDSLESVVKHLKWKTKDTEWGDYYRDTNYSQAAFEHKQQVVDKYLTTLQSKNVWDLGGNTGIFTRLASNKGIPCVCFDNDYLAVERNYLECKAKQETNILPLVMDFTNPSSALGWANTERMSLAERGQADTVLALALVHHLAISNNVPLPKIADYFAKLCSSLIIEFVPKDDSQVQRMLATRADVPNYTRSAFEQAFGRHFTLLNVVRINESERTLYLMSRIRH